jgi:hypothetical protein
MAESTRTVADDTLTAFLVRGLERIPQEARNRYARRIEAMGARHIARTIVGEMRSCGWTFDVPVRDPEACQSSYNRTGRGER